MTPRVDDADLLGRTEAAKLLGVAGPNLRKLQGLPAPVAELALGPVWSGEELRAFKAARERPTPPKWTQGKVRVAIRRFEERYGRVPTSLDFNPADARAKGHPGRAERFEADGDYPHVATVQKVCGSWSAALDDAAR